MADLGLSEPKLVQRGKVDVLDYLFIYFGCYNVLDSLKFNKRITSLSAAMLCSWSPTILMLLGRQGAFVALICITGGTLQVTQFLRQALLKI